MMLINQINSYKKPVLGTLRRSGMKKEMSFEVLVKLNRKTRVKWNTSLRRYIGLWRICVVGELVIIPKSWIGRRIYQKLIRSSLTYIIFEMQNSENTFWNKKSRTRWLPSDFMITWESWIWGFFFQDIHPALSQGIFQGQILKHLD